MDSLAYISEKNFQTEVFSQETGKGCCHSLQTPTRILSNDDFFKKMSIFECFLYTFGTKCFFHNLFYFSIPSLQRDFEDWVHPLFN